ncbi:pyridoxal phosphate-dependent aminotransferase [Thermoflexus sp.]|uniref:pyridoxal phosphate-dependent aminotransferase n=1 Tax=Thermoflexus sp. TaxID=1969742 RepID=UPI0025CFA90D|nr:pyridoxal phosphate-dependent aminotransferase [Thermoflexus sp.]MDW8180553.1 pyridoxal phosphate-dependent aminotransferase [Anaerolineae bacterium]MCS6964853.1 pyridoxal phosphate-dependent aminotransferase [Thermoflexus sp.]MCS7351100.1 pyridoxal phosphate-dependent aminotransferase [Thermoflexus sp.]MCX7690514.1 pyridoxal phosphate-dependent aminotransferase [Thermoflexus sp.]MDW8184473.1 pyridoxal phosphate-dependent aminotransferase [Anaerolineae bacterium]
MRLAQRMSRLGTETAFEVLARAKALEAQGREIIHLEIGEPDFDTPAHIKAAAMRALEEGYTHYTPAAGIPALRQTIAEYIRRTRGIPVGPENVVVVPGGKPIIFFSILALVEEDDEVIYPNPGFPIYESMIHYVGGRPVPLRLRMENEFRVDVEELARLITPRTRMLILNSPANPTGGVLTREDLAAIAELCVRHDLIVLSDEIYSRILYEGEHISIASFPGMLERTIILDGFSKTYAMTGWRLGYGVMPAPLAEAVTRLMINSNSCTAAFTQMAGITALTGPQDDVDRMVAAFRERREVMVEGLNRIPGFRCLKPRGAFYAFPNIEGTGMSSRELASYLLEEAGVAVLSGTAFGEYGEGFLRLSFANSVENIQKALERIEKVVRRLPVRATAS